MSTDITVKPVSVSANGEHGYQAPASLQTKRNETAPGAKRVVEPKEAKEAADDVQRLLKKLNTELRLEVRKDSRDVVIKIVDPETRKVLRQIPSEEMQYIRERLSAMAGVLLKTKS